MKTPKLLAAVPILALSASAVIGWSAVTRASQADASAENVAGNNASVDTFNANVMPV